MNEPVIPERWAPQYAACKKHDQRLEIGARIIEELGAAEAKVAELEAELDKWREREASVCPEDYGFEEVIKQQAAAIEELTNVLAFLRKTLPEEYWDSNELAQIDAALSKQEP